MNKQQKFQKEIKNFINTLNLIESDNSYKYCIETIYGKLYITMHDSDCEKPLSTKVYSIFCRFDDVDRVKNNENAHWIKSEMNPFTGKWNFHYLSSDSAIRIFKSAISKIIKN